MLTLINILLILLISYQIILANNNVEGYMAVIGPVIIPVNKPVNKPVNTYYKNSKITQDFDPDSVITFYN